MQIPHNGFKQALRAGKVQYGLWLGLVDPVCAEICAGAGFDWLLIDHEHAPNDVRTVLAQLQAVAPYPVHAVVRPVAGEVNLIKQLLDIGAQSLLVPMVETAAQAEHLAAAVRYPPRGMRGVAPSMVRASRWGAVDDYMQRADAEVCLLVQVETVTGLRNLQAIAAVAGVDGVFIGPADLAASLGFPGQQAHPEVKARIEQALEVIQAAGKAPGLMALSPDLVRHYTGHGARFIGVGIDASLFARETRRLAAVVRGEIKESEPYPASKY